MRIFTVLESFLQKWVDKKQWGGEELYYIIYFGDPKRGKYEKRHTDSRNAFKFVVCGKFCGVRREPAR